MSGIVAIFSRDRAPVDRELLGEMTRFLSFRGPDAQQVWVDEAVGLGHALLQTTGSRNTGESATETQPCTLDGQVWITADARVDGRAELVGKLESAGRQEARQATDPELILHAYQVWGEECLPHLIGDFAFVIWDKSRRRLFGARDHFGVKPFYYAEVGKSLLCGNTLHCLRLDPEVSSELNDLAIADFLLFDWNQDPAATYLAGIQRLPPAHYLVATEEAVQIKRYWTLPHPEVRYRRGWDYVDHFRELLTEAVKDRIRTDKVTVFMSGGADSTLVAAVAHKVLGKPSDRAGVRAQTYVFDKAFRDEERKYSGLAANFIAIPIHHLPADDYYPFDRFLERQFSKAEPQVQPYDAFLFDAYRQVAGYSRVTLSGYGGDPALHTDDGYISDYLKPGSMGELIVGIGWCIRLCRRLPRLGFRRLLKAKLGGQGPPVYFSYPRWLNQNLEKRLDLTGRWHRMNHKPASRDCARSRAHDALLDPMWPALFEGLDPGMTQFPIEQRHPFFDVRVVKFLTGLPALPWCQEKNILKAAGRGMLPDAVRRRRKTPLAGDPHSEYLRNCGPDWWSRHLNPVAAELTRYVNPDLIPRATAGSFHDIWRDLRLVSLNYWLQLGRQSPRVMEKKGVV